MKRAACLALFLFLSMALITSPAGAVSPYVHDIVREDDSVDGAVLVVERAEQANIFAQGYEKFNILGTRITIDGWVENATDTLFERTSLVITARDVFGKELDSCATGMRLPAGGREIVRCVLIVRDASKLSRVTYSITDKTTE